MAYAGRLRRMLYGAHSLREQTSPPLEKQRCYTSPPLAEQPGPCTTPASWGLNDNRLS